MPQRRAVNKTPSSGEGVVKEVVTSEEKEKPVQSLSLDEEKAPLSVEDRYEIEKHQMRIKQWRESPFAVGLTETNWMDERSILRKGQSYGDEDMNPDTSGCLCCSAMVCPLLGAGRVGNMAVLHSSMELVEEVDEDEETGEQNIRRYNRPKLNIVVGPYWPMLVFVTYPLIFGVSGWAFFKQILPGRTPFPIVVAWAIMTVGLILALACTACRDPGILYRYKDPPPQDENTWRWSDHAHTYRPRSAHFDSDTGVVVEDFDHTCPWTGTAIGKKNMPAFQIFVCLVFVCLVFDIFLITGTFN